MARSKNLSKYPSEHSWRGYAPFYKNTFEIMKEIHFLKIKLFMII